MNAAVPIDLYARRRRRVASFEAAFPNTAERALVNLHIFIHDELDPNPSSVWAGYHANGPELQLIGSLQERYTAWEIAFAESERAVSS